jgi:uncharacterized protein DUF5995
VGRGVLAISVAAVLAMPPNLPWPEVLPPRPVPADVQPGPVGDCVEPAIECVEQVVAEMTRRWEPLDADCDHRAVFALTYLRTTEAFLDTIRRDPAFFDDFDYVVWEDVLFAAYYFRAFDAYVEGRPGVPEAWRIAFDSAARGDLNAAQDVLVGMNAHIQRDLPYVLAELGLARPDGSTHKPDHDRVNEILATVVDPVQRELAARYDPFMSLSDLPAPVDELGALEVLKAWREGAWRNAERLLADPNRAAVEASIEINAQVWGRALSGAAQPGYRAQRDAHCRSR